MKPRNVVLVMLDRIEGHRKRKVGETRVDAIHLIDRHLIFFELIVGEPLLQHANQEIVREKVLLGKACGRDAVEARQKPDIFGVTTAHSFE